MKLLKTIASTTEICTGGCTGLMLDVFDLKMLRICCKCREELF